MAVPRLMDYARSRLVEVDLGAGPPGRVAMTGRYVLSRSYDHRASGTNAQISAYSRIGHAEWLSPACSLPVVSDPR